MLEEAPCYLLARFGSLLPGAPTSSGHGPGPILLFILAAIIHLDIRWPSNAWTRPRARLVLSWVDGGRRGGLVGCYP